MGEAVVSDAGPVIHLAQADALALLGLFDSLHVPRTVYDEIDEGGVPDGFDELDARIHECDPIDHESLDPGESAALSLCADVDGILLTDDLEARTVATAEGIEVHGSIGVVLYAYGEGAVSGPEADAFLDSLRVRVRSTCRNRCSTTLEPWSKEVRVAGDFEPTDYRPPPRSLR